MVFLISLILVPAAVGGMAFLVPSNRWRPWLLPLGATAHFVLVLWALPQVWPANMGDWLVLDPLGKVFLGFFSGLYSLCLFAAALYFTRQPQRSNRAFCGCLLLYLDMMTLRVSCH